MNFDEESHESFPNETKEIVVVPKNQEDPLYYPVCRKNNRTTFLSSIYADGDYLNPLFVLRGKKKKKKKLLIQEY